MNKKFNDFEEQRVMNGEVIRHSWYDSFTKLST